MNKGRLVAIHTILKWKELQLLLINWTPGFLSRNRLVFGCRKYSQIERVRLIQDPLYPSRKWPRNKNTALFCYRAFQTLLALRIKFDTCNNPSGFISFFTRLELMGSCQKFFFTLASTSSLATFCLQISQTWSFCLTVYLTWLNRWKSLLCTAP